MYMLWIYSNLILCDSNSMMNSKKIRRGMTSLIISNLESMRKLYELPPLGLAKLMPYVFATD